MFMYNIEFPLMTNHKTLIGTATANETTVTHMLTKNILRLEETDLIDYIHDAMER